MTESGFPRNEADRKPMKNREIGDVCDPMPNPSEWMQQTRLRQLCIAEATAWRTFARAGGFLVASFIAIFLGILLAGTDLWSHLKSGKPEWMRTTGFLIQGTGSMIGGLTILTTSVRFARWIGAMWARRRFSKEK